MELNGDFDEAAGRALDTAVARGAQYADVRFEVARSERIEVRNGIVAALADSTERRIRRPRARRRCVGVRRVLANPTRPASTRRPRAPFRWRAPAPRSHAGALGRLPSVPTSTASPRPCNAIPQDVPLGDRVALLLEAERALHAAPDISVGRAWIDLWRTDKYFFSTIGSRIAQRILQSGAGLEAMAVGDGDVQIRTYPGDVGLYQSGGWEIVEAATLARRCAANRRRGVAVAARAAMSERNVRPHPGRLADVAAVSRVLRSSGRTRSRHGMGSELFRNVLSRNRPAGETPVWIRCRDDRRRQHARSRHGDVRLRRRRHASGRSDIVRDGVLAGYEMSNDTARAIGRESNACVRAAGLGIRADDPHVQSQPAARATFPSTHLFDDVRTASIWRAIVRGRSTTGG